MNRPGLSRLGILLVSLAVTACGGEEPGEPGVRNVVLITADDLGLQLSSYGETLIQTPRMDELAALGVKFETAYVTQASCSSSRSSLMTGLYPHATGQYGLANHGFELHPELRSRTLPNLLRQHGFRTGLIGKLHVEPETSFQFEQRFAGVNAQRVKHVAEATRQFLAERSAKPFFLMISFADPHALRDPDNAWYFPTQIDGLPSDPLPPSSQTIFPQQQTDSEAQRVRTAGYYNGVQRLDAGVGMLLDLLARYGHLDDTLIVFVGDHGPPFCRGKTTAYEFGLRVPMIVHWPGVSEPASSAAMVSTVDLFPSILDAVGAPVPADIHGRSLRGVVVDPDAAHRDYLVGEFHFHARRPFFPRRAIRDQRYKLIHNLRAGEARPLDGIDGDRAYAIAAEPRYDGTDVRSAFETFLDPPEYELYDLQQDPIEFHNLAGRPEWQEIEMRLREALAAWREQTDDPFLDPAVLQYYADEAEADG